MDPETEPGPTTAERRVSDGDGDSEVALSAAPPTCEGDEVQMEQGRGTEEVGNPSENGAAGVQGVRVGQVSLQSGEGMERIGDDVKSGEKPPLPKRSGANNLPVKPVPRADHNAAGRSSRHNYNPSNPLYRNHDGRPTSGCHPLLLSLLGFETCVASAARLTGVCNLRLEHPFLLPGDHADSAFGRIPTA